MAHGIHVLGIESSCDDTGVAIVGHDGKILSNCVHSQLKRHLLHGGIIPMVAKEYHVDNIDRIAKQAFQESGLLSVAQNIDTIAVSTRPGFNFSLQVGLNYAKTLAKKYSKPLIPIHHMQAHALMPLLQNRFIKFPFIALLISGGHCLLTICERYNKFHLLGSTHDDAPGDLLDKVARRMRLKNLGPPFDSISGGAAIELLSQRKNANRFKYFNCEESVPMIRQRNCDFSFAGYRGVFEKIVPTIDQLWESGDRDKLLDELGHVCGSLQRAILIQLFRKLQRAMLFYRMYWRYNNPDAFNQENSNTNHLGFGIRRANNEDFDWLDVVVSGGVAANSYLIEGLKLACKQDIDPNFNVHAPTKDLCSDNGLMVAWNGLLRYLDCQKSQINNEVDLNDSVIFDPKQMDLVEAISEYPIGLDITQQVKHNDFKLSKLTFSELKLKSKH